MSSKVHAAEILSNSQIVRIRRIIEIQTTREEMNWQMNHRGVKKGKIINGAHNGIPYTMEEISWEYIPAKEEE